MTGGCEDCLPPENEPNEFERDAAPENLYTPKDNVCNISAESGSVSCSCNDHCCNSASGLGSVTLEDSNSDHNKPNMMSGILSDMDNNSDGSIESNRKQTDSSCIDENAVSSDPDMSDDIHSNN